VAKLVFQSGPYAGKSVMLPAGKTLTMGRNRDLELPLPDLKLSRRHCQVSFIGDRCMIKDLGSTNGTFLNGERLSMEVELNDFDRIVLGDTEIEFHHEADKVPLPHNFNTEAADPFGVHANIPDRGVIQAQAVDNFIQPPVAQVSHNLPDPFDTALLEMLQPLPPEPPPLKFADEAAARKPKLMFCEGCEGSVPMLDWDLGLAREIDNKIYCKDCLAKGVVVGPQKMEEVKGRPSLADAGISAMLAGLDGEAEVVDTTLKRAGKEVTDGDAARRLSELERAKQQNISRRVEPPKQAPQKVSSSASLKEDMGDEFEEIK
jgi:pSer/pThr/pTyr-binding forkhead associated (FHA) protein